MGNSESKNLPELLQLLLQQYQDYVDRKERLENKALGYLTPLSIILAASVAIIIMVIQGEREKGLSFFIFLFFFFGQVYFSIWTFVFALKAYSVKSSYYPNIKEYSESWKIEKSSFLGGISRSFLTVIGDLEETLEKLVADVQYCRIFLTFSLIFGILTLVFFIVHFVYLWRYCIKKW
jgi:hypothetical protein